MDRRLDINLLPPEFQPQPSVRWHPIYLAALYSITLFLVVYFVLMSLNHVKKLEAEIATVNESVTSLQPFADAYDKAEQSVKSLENLKQLFVYLDAQYVDWPMFFYHLEPNLPKGVWLTAANAEVVTKAPEKKAAPAPAPAPAPATPAKGGSAAPATPATPPVPEPPLRTGDIVLEGRVNGYSLTPLSTFLKNLQADPYFSATYLQDSALEEDEKGVTRSFKIIVRVKDPKQAAEEAAAAAKPKPAAAPQQPVSGSAEGGHAQ
jgi:Tfp pilus assembly protein PilN